MRRDIIASVFLFFTFWALLFAYFYPVYYTHGQILFREVPISERVFSVLFVLVWLALCVGSAYFKQVCLFIGGILYALIPYTSSWGISLLSQPAEGSDVSILSELILNAFVRIYELSQAPLVGVSILFEPENGAKLSFYLLPLLLASYLGVKLFRFYRNAYLAEQLRLDDISPGLKRSNNVDIASAAGPSSNGHRKMRVRQPEGAKPESENDASPSSNIRNNAQNIQDAGSPAEDNTEGSNLDETPLEE